jgi:hypothetical protein
MDMEEILPILIGVVWFAYKMYQGAQKKASKAKPIIKPTSEYSPKVQENAPEMGMDELMKTIFGVPSTPKPSPIMSANSDSVEYEYENVEHYDSGKYENIEEGYETYQPQISIESVENFSPSISRHDQIVLDQAILDETAENENYTTYFDVRKAIIYDAILNRPYV